MAEQPGEHQPPAHSAMTLLSHGTLVLIADDLLTLAARYKAERDALHQAIVDLRVAIGGNHPGSSQADYDLDRSLAPLWRAADEIGSNPPQAPE